METDESQKSSEKQNHDKSPEQNEESDKPKEEKPEDENKIYQELEERKGDVTIEHLKGPPFLLPKAYTDYILNIHCGSLEQKKKAMECSYGQDDRVLITLKFQSPEALEQNRTDYETGYLLLDSRTTIGIFRDELYKLFRLSKEFVDVQLYRPARKLIPLNDSYHVSLRKLGSHYKDQLVIILKYELRGKTGQDVLLHGEPIYKITEIGPEIIDEPENSGICPDSEEPAPKIEDVTPENNQEENPEANPDKNPEEVSKKNDEETVKENPEENREKNQEEISKKNVEENSEENPDDDDEMPSLTMEAPSGEVSMEYESPSPKQQDEIKDEEIQPTLNQAISSQNNIFQNRPRTRPPAPQTSCEVTYHDLPKYRRFSNVTDGRYPTSNITQRIKIISNYLGVQYTPDRNDSEVLSKVTQLHSVARNNQIRYKVLSNSYSALCEKLRALENAVMEEESKRRQLDELRGEVDYAFRRREQFIQENEDQRTYLVAKLLAANEAHYHTEPTPHLEQSDIQPPPQKRRSPPHQISPNQQRLPNGLISQNAFIIHANGPAENANQLIARLVKVDNVPSPAVLTLPRNTTPYGQVQSNGRNATKRPRPPANKDKSLTVAKSLPISPCDMRPNKSLLELNEFVSSSNELYPNTHLRWQFKDSPQPTGFDEGSTIRAVYEYRLVAEAKKISPDMFLELYYLGDRPIRFGQECDLTKYNMYISRRRCNQHNVKIPSLNKKVQEELYHLNLHPNDTDSGKRERFFELLNKSKEETKTGNKSVEENSYQPQEHRQDEESQDEISLKEQNAEKTEHCFEVSNEPTNQDEKSKEVSPTPSQKKKKTLAEVANLLAANKNMSQESSSSESNQRNSPTSSEASRNSPPSQDEAQKEKNETTTS